MAVIDTTQDLSRTTRREPSHTGTIVLFAFFASALLAASALVVNAAEGNGWYMAAEIVVRFSLLLFVAAMIVEPLARLIPSNVLAAAGRERGSLTLGFAAASAVGLFCVVAPFEFGGEGGSAAAVAYCGMTAVILVVMLFSAHPATIRFLGAPAWRALHRISTAYFWIAFTLMGLQHLVGPHLPDRWYGFSLLLLTFALLLRFVDSLVAHWRRPQMAEKVA